MDPLDIRILDPRLGTEFPLPAYATEGAAAMDVRAMIEAPLTVNPGEVHLVPLGFAMHLSNPNLAALLLPRSGTGHKQGMVLGNLVGLIDADYQGPVMASLWNRHDTAPFTIQPGDRIAQMVIVPVVRPVLRVVDNFETSARGDGGFGSTGAR